MKKQLLLGIVVVALAAAFFFYKSYTKSFSPPATAHFEQSGLLVKVDYCQPSKKGRFIFGRQEDGAVVPYGKVWRTGANEATLITLSRDVLFAGRQLKAGTYSLWTVPGPAKWKVIINTETGQWGTQYNDGMDLFRTEVGIRIQSKVTEKLRFYFEEKEKGASMIIVWDQTEVIVPIERV
jgi:hypothetical protein